MSIVLSLDISSRSTGHAVFKNGKLLKRSLGTIATKAKTHGERLEFFEESLWALIDKYQPTLIVVEDIWYGRNLKTFRILSYYHGIVHKVSWQHNNELPLILGTSEVRSLIGQEFDINLMPSKKIRLQMGIEKTSKELTFDFIKNKFKFKDYVFKTHNDITDAVAICLAHSLIKEVD